MIGKYILRRILQIIPILFAISILIFCVIQLPPGDYLTTYIENLKRSGGTVTEQEIQRLRIQYNLDKSMPEQYLHWIGGIITKGDFGFSFEWNKPVAEVIGPRIGLTIGISLLSTAVTWLIAFPIGVYVATHQYSLGDYVATILGFIGMSIPGFLLAMILLFVVFVNSGELLIGLYASEYLTQGMSWAKFCSALPRMAMAVLILGLSSTAGMVRQTRALVLDELEKQYVITARAKGISERRVLFKYPIRMALNPTISTIGWMLPGMISGETIISIVLNMPTVGPVMKNALMAQDMWLAGSFLLIVAVLTVIGTLISDILLAVLDPRIRYGGAD